MAKKVVLAGACRTAIGTMGGGLSTTPAPVLGSIVIKEALNRAGVPADKVDHVYMGCVIQAGLGQNSLCSYAGPLWLQNEQRNIGRYHGQ